MRTREKSYKTNMMKSLLIFTFFACTASALAQEKELEWTLFEEAIQLAKEEQKLLMVDVWAPWCGWCKKMREEVYPELIDEINKDFVLTRINRDDNDTNIRYQNYKYTPLRLAQKLKIDTVPGIIFLNSKGEYIAHVTGFQNKDKLNKILDIVGE